MAKKTLAFVLSAALLIVIAAALIVVLRKVKNFPIIQGDILRRSDDIDYSKLATGTVAFRLDQVLERAGPRLDLDMIEQREFDFYLDRSDLKLKQQKNERGDKYTPDLRPELRPVRLSVSDIDDRAHDSGNSCDFGGFPYRCTLHLTAKEAGKPKTILIKVVFADKTYAEKETIIPYAGMLKEPVILEPKTTPNNGETIRFKFKDVGADEYEIAARICHPYRGDGINPCLKGREGYIISKKDGDFVWLYSTDDQTQPEKNITFQNGTLDITLPAKYDFSDEDTSVKYSVIATLTGQTDDGVKTYLTSSADLELKR